MNNAQSKLTLDHPATYCAMVPGKLDKSWLDWHEGLQIETENLENGQFVTTLTVTFDQAGLLGLLRRLYSYGLPIISVIYIDIG